MSYEYTIYAPSSTEEVIATIQVPEPLPHIQVGHSLLLESESYSTKIGSSLEIRHIEVYVFASDDTAQSKRARIYVYTRELSRSSLPE